MVEVLFCNQGVWVRFLQGAPIYGSLVLTAARQSPKLLVGVRISQGSPFLGCVQQTLYIELLIQTVKKQPVISVPG
jgi:hypothetical protein